MAVGSVRSIVAQDLEDLDELEGGLGSMAAECQVLGGLCYSVVQSVS